VSNPDMQLVSRKGVLAIAAVIDVAINASTRPVSAGTLAARHRLPPRHLEPVLQALVRVGILKGTRGPHGGYTLGRERNRIQPMTFSARPPPETREAFLSASKLINEIVQPERAFSVALGCINIDDMARRAESLK
jgi:Rrf2 family transcriptional regulator, iron-sulfur cluster assembly transcription factor